MHIARGTTGFRASTDFPLSVMDEQAFQVLCHMVAIELNGRVDYAERLGEYREKNFSLVTLTVHNTDISVMLNVHCPYLAFALPVSRNHNTLSFIDWPVGTESFNRYGDYTILTYQQLSKPFVECDISSLADAEHDQVKYWRPQTVGELIFNFWD